ncbi:MAG: HlyD family type I secretion periplasmic adaptor subunit [Rickettsiales bacterium]|nr:HlyD family type I secretion periplasmic adaptor subunit [Rickettsiales bacterium]
MGIDVAVKSQHTEADVNDKTSETTKHAAGNPRLDRRGRLQEVTQGATNQAVHEGVVVANLDQTNNGEVKQKSAGKFTFNNPFQKKADDTKTGGAMQQDTSPQSGAGNVSGNTEENDIPVSSDKASLPVRAGNWLEKSASGGAVQKYMSAMDRGVKYISGPVDTQSDDILEATRGPVRFGVLLFLFVFVFIGGMSAVAPIDTAAVAHGRVVLEKNRKVIQHLEGGIVSEILVREGDEVLAGQSLVRLNDISAKARLDILTSQLRVARATEGRLLAERDNQAAISFHQGLMESKDNPEVAQVIDAQQRLFVSRRKALIGQINVLKQRIAQLNDEISGLQAQEVAAGKQLTLISAEVSDVEKLVDKGLAQKPRLLALQRQSAELEGLKGELQARIARAEQNIAENEMQMINLQNQNLSDVLAQLRETQAQIADLEERIRAAEDVFSRIVITAPQSGVVQNLKVHTVGGVVSPGQPVMEIVPTDDKLVVEARVRPQDIDVVHAGLPARMRLLAFKMRKVPVVDGEVTQISPDINVDTVTGDQFYKALVEVDGKTLDNLKELEGLELKAGMPVDVLIVTGRKTPLRYLFDPLVNFVGMAFHED